jgi:hypothetical protein
MKLSTITNLNGLRKFNHLKSNTKEHNYNKILQIKFKAGAFMLSAQ